MTVHAAIETNAGEVGRTMELDGVRARRKAAAVTRMYAEVARRRIVANASGRPGPRRVTGDYARSWAVDLSITLDEIVATVGTNKPQGRRLEYGFVGTDSLGRVYNQPAYPHIVPAFDQTVPEYLDALGGLAA